MGSFVSGRGDQALWGAEHSHASVPVISAGKHEAIEMGTHDEDGIRTNTGQSVLSNSSQGDLSFRDMLGKRCGQE